MRLKLGPSSQGEWERAKEDTQGKIERDRERERERVRKTAVCVCVCVYLCVPKYMFMCLSVLCVGLCMLLHMHFVGTSTGFDTSTEERGVTWTHPVPAALCLSRFRSQSYDMAHSAAAQHAALFICVHCGAVLSVLGLGFWLLLAICLREREVLPLQTDCQVMLGLLWQQDTGHQRMCGEWGRIPIYPSVSREENLYEMYSVSCDLMEINKPQR